MRNRSQTQQTDPGLPPASNKFPNTRHSTRQWTRFANCKTRSRLPIGHLSEEDKTQAAELIARLREENRILTLKLRAVTASRDQYQTENGELKRQITRQRRKSTS